MARTKQKTNKKMSSSMVPPLLPNTSFDFGSRIDHCGYPNNAHHWVKLDNSGEYGLFDPFSNLKRLCAPAKLLKINPFSMAAQLP
jgi:hypothetical protein